MDNGERGSALLDLRKVLFICISSSFFLSSY